MPTCKGCGKVKKFPNSLWPDKNMKGPKGAEGFCMDCCMKENFEYMGTFKSAGKRVVIE